MCLCYCRPLLCLGLRINERDDCMSEKRFKPLYPSLIHKIVDSDGKRYTLDDLCVLLNEQQATINELSEKIDEMSEYFGELENDLLCERKKHTDHYYSIPKDCDHCLFLGNNGVCGYCKFTLECYDSEDDLTDYGSLPSCPFKHHHEYDTMVENWDSLVSKCAEISKRNIELNEQVAKEMGEKINVQEKLSYMVWKYNKLKQENMDLQIKLDKICEETGYKG